ncbi:unnamed protein product [Microthlaspi erraticum]|uniref:Arabidopsis retrotransposon Orf1 C-terminal domain-containing protein n=1 Tax=Microthlaspi erraticum TaxID=1685480 RepID=A0A6D2JXR6_9BRAS|nr:unnamed protein product [Microthlaspi erraticum]
MDGRYQFKFTHPLAGPSKLLLPNPELTRVVGGENVDFKPPLYTLVGHEDDLREEEPELDRGEDRAEAQGEDRAQGNADLDEPECYYFEEYQAPRMNPSVVAAHKRIGLLQKFNKSQGKAIEKMQKSMDKMVSKIKSSEKKVSGSSSKKKKTPMTPTFPRSRSLLTTPRRLHTQEPHRASSFEPREGEDNLQRRRKSSKARRFNSTTRLDRVQTEETQLDRADGRVGLEEPQFENPGFESFGAFWSIWDVRSMEGLGMDAAQLDTQRKKGEAILKTSSTPTRPTGRVPQLDRPSFNSIELRSQSQTRKMLLPP